MRLTAAILGLTAVIVFGWFIYNHLQPLKTNHNVKLEALYDQGVKLLDSNIDSARETAKQLVTLSDKAHYLPGIVKGHWLLGYVFDEERKLNNAFYHYKKVLKYIDQTDPPDYTIKKKTLNNLGMIYYLYQQYDLAIDAYDQALEIAETHLNEEHVYSVLYNRGIAYKKKGDKGSFLKAEEDLQKTLKIAKKNNDRYRIVWVHLQVGMMYKEIEEYEVARYAYHHAIKVARNGTENLNELIGKAYHGIGVSYLKEGKLKDAITNYELAIKNKKSSKSLFVSHLDLGKAYEELGEIDRATDMWEKALTYSYDTQNKEHIEVFVRLYAAKKETGHLNEAIRYNDQYLAHLNTINHAHDHLKREYTAVIFKDVARKWEEYEQLETYRYYTFLGTGTALALLSLLIFGMVMYKDYKRKAFVRELEKFRVK